MIKYNFRKCPNCDGSVIYYDKVKRIIKIEYGIKTWTELKRFRCLCCGKFHREITNDIYPYKHYKLSIILNFLNNNISNNDIEYEDYPCETTIIRWRNDVDNIK
nr:MAG TPA: MqsA [Caudoviricetes sp.]